MVDPEELKELLYTWFHEYRCNTPAPGAVKYACLLRHSCHKATWVETGTHEGAGTKFLAQFAGHIYTIEPSEEFFLKSKSELKNLDNVTTIKGYSEDVFPKLIPTLSGEVCFWLDGHFCGEGTGKSSVETPIKFELNEISRHISFYEKCVVLIDDIRLCGTGDYPPLEYYVFWALQNNLNWTIEHDIFIAKTKSLDLYPISPDRTLT